MKMSRREAIQLGIVNSGALFLTLGSPKAAFAACKDISSSNPPFSSKNPLFSAQFPPFQIPFQIPKVLQPVFSDTTIDYYEIVVQPAQVEILPERKTQIWSYNGILPGPTIRQQCGRQSVVRFINHLETPTVTHLHGMASKPEYDGYPEDLIPPNHYKDYIYPNNWPSTFWYHDHTIHNTSRNVYAGLAGMYIVEDDFENNLRLPHGDYDVPLIIQDKKFTNDGELVFDDLNQRGLYGDVILVNGVPWPRMEVAKRKYRFRVLNAGASRTYQLSLLNTQIPQIEGFWVIATDAGLIEAPVLTKTLTIGVGERYGFIIDFSKYDIGTRILLKNLTLPVNINSDTRAQDVMCFDVVRQESDDSIIPSKLRPFEPISESAAVRERTFRFDRNGGQWKINNKTWNCDAVDYKPQLGDIEIWNLVNPGGGWIHPVHIHLLDWQLLDRNGVKPGSFSYERGWKDTFYVGEFQTVRIITKFDPGYICAGRYVMHCHNLVHEDHDMMTQFEVGEGGSSPLSASAKPLPAPSFDSNSYNQQGYCAQPGCRSN